MHAISFHIPIATFHRYHSSCDPIVFTYRNCASTCVLPSPFLEFRRLRLTDMIDYRLQNTVSVVFGTVPVHRSGQITDKFGSKFGLQRSIGWSC
jgi:hypothetical protein